MRLEPRVPVSTPHGSQGTQAYKGDDVVSGGAAADSPSYFSSLWASGEAHSRRRTRVKQAENGWRRGAVAPG